MTLMARSDRAAAWWERVMREGEMRAGEVGMVRVFSYLSTFSLARASERKRSSELTAHPGVRWKTKKTISLHSLQVLTRTGQPRGVSRPRARPAISRGVLTRIRPRTPRHLFSSHSSHLRGWRLKAGPNAFPFSQTIPHDRVRLIENVAIARPGRRRQASPCRQVEQRHLGVRVERLVRGRLQTAQGRRRDEGHLPGFHKALTVQHVPDAGAVVGDGDVV